MPKALFWQTNSRYIYFFIIMHLICPIDASCTTKNLVLNNFMRFLHLGIHAEVVHVPRNAGDTHDNSQPTTQRIHINVRVYLGFCLCYTVMETFQVFKNASTNPFEAWVARTGSVRVTCLIYDSWDACRGRSHQSSYVSHRLNLALDLSYAATKKYTPSYVMEEIYGWSKCHPMLAELLLSLEVTSN